MNNHIDLERAKKGLLMENRDISVVPKSPPGYKGGFWGKNVLKKLKILHAGVILEKKKSNQYSGFS